MTETIYLPLKAPALPLAVRDPYTSLWSSTANGSNLNTQDVMFWTGKRVALEGVAYVDNEAYQWLGNSSSDSNTVKKAELKQVSYDSQYSNFTFHAGPVKILAQFFSPVIPEDLCRTSIPLSYLIIDITAMDDNTHRVDLYNSISGLVVTPQKGKSLSSSLEGDFTNRSNHNLLSATKKGLIAWIFGLEEQVEFGEDSDFSSYGNYTFTTNSSSLNDVTYMSGPYVNVLSEFIKNKKLKNTIYDNHLNAEDHVFAFTHNLANVSDFSQSVVLSLGSIRESAIKFATKEGNKTLTPWWSKCYGGVNEMISFHYNDLRKTQLEAWKWEMNLRTNIDSYFEMNGATSGYHKVNSSELILNSSNSGTNNIGQAYEFNSTNGYGFLNPKSLESVPVPGISEADAYYSIVSLSARQVMGSLVLAVPPRSQNTTEEENPLVLMKEISSDGNANTVDVIFPSMPFFLYANPNVLEFVLNPLLDYQTNGLYPNDWSMHDMGTHFPNVTGHPDGNDESMPVEESADMIIMMLSTYRVTKNKNWLKKHYPLLKKWSNYLIEFGLMPENQLSTDDFAGKLVNQTNLAIKGIVGLRSMAEISLEIGERNEATNFTKTSQDYMSRWETLAIDPTKTHTILAYQWRSSWGLLYNTYPDKLLKLGLVDDKIYKMQSEWYPRVSQEFGIPLDNRHSYTKSDWELWTAATTSSSTRCLFISSIAYWLNNTSTDRGFSDLHETINKGEYPVSPDPVYFIARPVVGGHFSLLALAKLNHS